MASAIYAILPPVTNGRDELIDDETQKRLNASAAYMRRMDQHTQEISQLEIESKRSAIKIAELAEKQVKLTEQANERADRAEQNSRVAGRYTIYATIVAILSAIIALLAYYRN